MLVMMIIGGDYVVCHFGGADLHRHRVHQGHSMSLRVHIGPTPYLLVTGNRKMLGQLFQKYNRYQVTTFDISVVCRLNKAKQKMLPACVIIMFMNEAETNLKPVVFFFGGGVVSAL